MALTNQQLEQKKLDDFMARARKFLVEDPYFVYLLTLEGGRHRRRQVAKEFAKLATTIPKVGDSEEGTSSNDGLVLNRALRRSLGTPQRRAHPTGSGGIK